MPAVWMQACTGMYATMRSCNHTCVPWRCLVCHTVVGLWTHHNLRMQHGGFLSTILHSYRLHAHLENQCYGRAQLLNSIHSVCVYICTHTFLHACIHKSLPSNARIVPCSSAFCAELACSSASFPSYCAVDTDSCGNVGAHARMCIMCILCVGMHHTECHDAFGHLMAARA